MICLKHVDANRGGGCVKMCAFNHCCSGAFYRATIGKRALQRAVDFSSKTGMVTNVCHEKVAESKSEFL